MGATDSALTRVPIPQSKGTNIKEAIKQWVRRGGGLCLDVRLNNSPQEEKHDKKVADEAVVKLYGKLPPIEKMDAALSQLAHVE